MTKEQEIAEKIERNLYAIPAYDCDYFQLQDLVLIAEGIAQWAERHFAYRRPEIRYACIDAAIKGNGGCSKGCYLS